MRQEDYAYMVGMDEEKIEEHLRSTTTGVLSLANDSDAYAVPVAHVYDGDTLYFRLGETNRSTKRSFLEHTQTARFVVFDTDQPSESEELESWSIVLTGTVDELPQADQSEFDTSAINRLFPPLYVFDESIPEIEITIAEFDIDRAIGRRTALT